MTTLNKKYFSLLSNISEARTQKLLSIVLTLIALCLFGLFAINPTLSTIAKLRKEIDDNAIINQKLGEKIAALSSLQQAYSRLEGRIPTILESIPSSSSVPLFIGQLQSVAKNSNIHVSLLQNSHVDLFKEVKTSEKFNFYTFNLAGEGAYENITKFIESIINIQRIVGINVSTIENAENKETLQFNFQGVAYYKE
jgi:Tfp pilus assembly protein PilO